ncbi:MAG: RNA-directed DNA polymerase [Anaerolineaceae bacterium]|nr:RNA-directed DNA polymerase [Anaerolineaceae bacterium]
MVKKNNALWYPPMNSYQSYSDCLNNLNPDEVFEGLLGYGLFSQSIVPIFHSEEFLDYCLKTKPIFSKKTDDYIRYESMRNTNMVRILGIPTPFTYYNLCVHIRENWTDILKHFTKMTAGQQHKISRLHIRKQFNTKVLFSMNYQSWWADETPSTDLSIGARYKVHADISTCFPSIYTHCITWAIKTKKVAKTEKQNKDWVNTLDKLTGNTTNQETHGLLIGPHASNLLSELILTRIDQELYAKNFSFIRHIDDYTCFVESYERGEEFIMRLRRALKEYGLSLNDKKTSFETLPIAEEKNWKNRLGYEEPQPLNGIINYRQLQRFLDLTTNLLYQNDDNLSVLKYSMKMVSGFPLNNGATILAQKYFLQMAAIYPYLIPELEQYVFKDLKTDPKIIEDWANEFYEELLNRSCYEAVSYLLYYSLIYKFNIKSVTVDHIVDTPDCIFKTIGALYFKKYKPGEFGIIHQEAVNLSDDTQYWLFWYTVLSSTELKGDWVRIKKKGIEFVHKI